MDLPIYENEALSAILPLKPEPEPGAAELWAWVPLWRDQDSADKAMQWYQQNDAIARTMLTFAINPQPKGRAIIPLLNPYPVPQIGEYGTVDTGDGETLTNYFILDMPIEVRQLWLELGETIRKLSDPLLWPEFNQFHEIASNEDHYRSQMYSLDTRMRLAIGKTKEDLIIRGALLGAAHIHLEELRKALTKSDQAELWGKVQQMAHELARAYYEHHVAKNKTMGAAPEPEPMQEDITPLQDALQTMVQPYLLAEDDKNIPAPAIPKQKRGSRPMQEPTPIVAKKQKNIPALSHKVNIALVPMLRDKDNYKHFKEQTTARGVKNFGKEYGSMTIDIKPAEGEGWDSVLSALNTLGDEVVDAYFATMAIGLDHNGIEHIREPFLISPDDILEVCGKEKSDRSYTPAQRIETIKHLKTLSMVNISASLPAQNKFHTRGRGRPKRGEVVTSKGTFIKAEGPLIHLLNFKIGEYSTITGEALWERRSISIGEWATMIPDLDKNTAIMLRQVLKYSAKKQRYQKRIGTYLTLMFRVNASRGGSFPHGISMQALLEGAGIKPDYHRPGEFKEATTRALEDLKKDSVIKGYYQMVDAQSDHQQIAKEVKEQARGWFDLWLQQKYNFVPPESLQEQYKSVQERAESKRNIPPRGRN